MSRHLSSPAPLRRTACAALLLVTAAALAACGPGGPKVETDDSSGSGSTTPSSGISLVAGNATVSGSTDANGSKARFSTPRGIAVDGSGNLFVADEGNRVIRKIATDGTVTTFAGVVGNTLGSADGNGTRARFSDPTALTIDASGNLYVTDGDAIRKITSSADVTTLTTATLGSSFDISTQPAGIAIDGSGNLFVTNSVGTVRLSGSNYRTETMLESGLAFDYGLGTGVLAPRGIAVDSNGVAYVADLGNTISRANSGINVLTRFAGVQGSSGSADGNANSATFRQVVALTVARDGSLYAADAQNNTVRKITSSGVTSTIAGRPGNTTLSTGGLPGSLANVAGIASDANGYLYVTSGDAVVRIVP